MKVLIFGATGLIGSTLCAALTCDGHEVVAGVRPGSKLTPMGVACLSLDLSKAALSIDWVSVLAGVDAVINCAGTLQDGGGETTEGVHVDGPSALYRACRDAGVTRVIHFSAIGVDRAQPTAFSRTKHRAEHIVEGLALDWVILRPSVVLGDRVFGASALFRGLAALPILPLMPDTGPLQVVRLEDVVTTVRYFLSPGAASRIALDVAGPQRLAFEEVVALHRKWMGWPKATLWNMPDLIARLAYGLGDLAGQLGWRSPMRSTARKEIARGAVGDERPWAQLVGVAPQSLEDALISRPAGVQDRWFARLYFVKPVAFIVLPFFWILTGIISLSIGWREGLQLLILGGTGPLAAPGVIAGALADISVGTLIAFRRTSRWGLMGAIALSVFYAVSGTFVRPDLWNDPLGPFLKIFPIIVAHLFALAILEER